MFICFSMGRYSEVVNNGDFLCVLAHAMEMGLDTEIVHSLGVSKMTGDVLRRIAREGVEAPFALEPKADGDDDALNL